MSYSICCPPILIPIEIIDDNDNNIGGLNNNIIKKTFPLNQVEICPLKEKVICEYFKILSNLKRGKQDDLEFLLEEISAILLQDSNSVLQYYINNQP